IVETVFAIPGIGRAFVTAIESYDYPMILGTTILFAAVIAVCNLIVDILYVFIDPRSEEHTSELQSLTNLVCRLLLEKKNPPSTAACSSWSGGGSLRWAWPTWQGRSATDPHCPHYTPSSMSSDRGNNRSSLRLGCRGD